LILPKAPAKLPSKPSSNGNTKMARQLAVRGVYADAVPALGDPGWTQRGVWDRLLLPSDGEVVDTY
jgi:hypothetical protein